MKRHNGIDYDLGKQVLHESKGVEYSEDLKEKISSIVILFIVLAILSSVVSKYFLILLAITAYYLHEYIMLLNQLNIEIERARMWYKTAYDRMIE